MPRKGPGMALWKCVDCGYETDERWLMCPECTTEDDWKEARNAVQNGAENCLVRGS
jgi:hypothetical protein